MKSFKNTVCLFDIDGTLTESRQKIKKDVLESLEALSQKTEIGLLTGSGLEYIKDQLIDLLASKKIKSDIHILPCNGVEYYMSSSDKPGEFTEIHTNSMMDKLGFEKFQKIMKTIMILQARIAESNYDISFSGHHIQNRGSTINWSPIGRNANRGERSQFIAMDKIYQIRKNFIKHFNEIMKKDGVEGVIVKLAGDTSFDIYPEGWDKTYALKHFPEDQWDVFFIGDRCFPEGNDFEIFNALRPAGKAFQTMDPQDTIDIINQNLHTIIGR